MADRRPAFSKPAPAHPAEPPPGAAAPGRGATGKPAGLVTPSVGVPPELIRRSKVASAQSGQSMQELATRWISEGLDRRAG